MSIYNSTPPIPTESNVTVIPDDPDDTNVEEWLEENAVVTSVVGVSVAITIGFIVFWWCRTRKRGKPSNADPTANDKADLCENAQLPNHASTPYNNDALPNSFVVIQGEGNKIAMVGVNTPNSEPFYQEKVKSKQKLAVPPVFMVKQRKSAPPESKLRIPEIGIPSRWSTAGLQTNLPKASERIVTTDGGGGSSWQSGESTPAAAPGGSNLLSIPMVYRKVSSGQHHAVYVPETRKISKYS